jgi:hypothetical protein
MISALLAVALVAQGDALGGPNPDFIALDAAGATGITMPVRRCFRSRANSYRPSPREIGRPRAAEAFVRAQLAACGSAEARTRLIAALRRSNGRSNRAAATRRAGMEMNAVVLEARLLSRDTFQLPLPPPPMVVQPDWRPAPSPKATER